ncbi:MAG: ceramidase domain-containing protein [Betaproteobacteria bacterium]|nr:ceramidase domain-containing protein [Betaproteobacteria bacterium]
MSVGREEPGHGAPGGASPTPEPGAGTRRQWRAWTLVLVVLAPLVVMMLVLDPIRQDPAYHLFADYRSYCGVPNFLNAVSNIPFLIVGAIGLAFCLRNPVPGALRSWQVFFLGVALVFLGSGYYHWAPDNRTLVWDRLPMTIAFMGLFAALLAEHMGAGLERVLLAPAVAVGIASVAWWAYSDDLRFYGWVQFAPLLAIPFALAAYPARYTHRRYLLYGLACYLLAKVAEFYDPEIFTLTSRALSGHSLKHLVSAVAGYYVFRMLQLRQPVGAPIPPPGQRQGAHGDRSEPRRSTPV